VLLETKLTKGGVCIHAQDLLRRSIRKQRNRNGDQPSHEVRVAVATVVQSFFAFGVRLQFAHQPNLADAAPNLVGAVVRFFAQRLERMPKLDDIAIPILPIIEGSKVFANDVDRRQSWGQSRWVRSALLYGRPWEVGQRPFINTRREGRNKA
jgi:hypothetical protein